MTDAEMYRGMREAIAEAMDVLEKADARLVTCETLVQDGKMAQAMAHDLVSQMAATLHFEALDTLRRISETVQRRMRDRKANAALEKLRARAAELADEGGDHEHR